MKNLLLIILLILIVILCCGCAENRHKEITLQPKLKARRDSAWSEYFGDKFRPSGQTYSNWWLKN